MNLNRSIHGDDDENAQKAAEDQNSLTLSGNDLRAATRLGLQLGLSPADADHERLAGVQTDPEWNNSARSHMALAETRRIGQTVHRIIIGEHRQDWFARIFWRGGFHLLPRPQAADPRSARHLSQPDTGDLPCTVYCP